MTIGEKYTIGLHEIKVNIGLHQDIVDGYAFWLGKGLTARYLLEGKLMNPEEAKTAGYVDKVCPMEDVLENAEQQMATYLKADPQIFQSIKFKARKNWIENLGKNEDSEIAESLAIWWKPEVRKKMKKFVEKLTTK